MVKINLYGKIVIVSIILSILFMIFDSPSFLIYAIINLIILSISHFALAKPLYYLRGKKEKETIIEHFILVFIAFLVIWIIDFYTGQQFSMKYLIYMFLISIGISYLISASHFMIYKDNNLIVDIGGYLLALLVSYILLKSEILLIFMLISLFGFMVYGIYKKIY